jgi:hypothetical protein
MATWKVFHSHAWTDKPAVLPIKAALDAAGIPGWIDSQQMDGGGDSLFAQIADGIGHADVVLLYLSPAYVTRANCRKEVALAVDYGKRLLPILLPGTPWPLHSSLGAYAGEIAMHLAGKLYISAETEGRALVDKIVGALGKMGVSAGSAPVALRSLQLGSVPGSPKPATLQQGAASPPAAPAATLDIPWDQLTPAPASSALLQGGMGIVLRGTWQAPRRAPRAVAVKVLKAALLPSASQAGALAALQSEAGAMVAASDGNLNEFVVQLYGLARGPAPAAWLAALGAGAAACQLQLEGGSGGGGGGGGGGSAQLLALVLRWEEGGTLHELLHSPTRAWGAGTGERLELCAQIASGLGALHYCSAGTIVHGDIKAENVLLSHAPGVRGAPRPRISVSVCRASSLPRLSAALSPPNPPLTTRTRALPLHAPSRRTLALPSCARLRSAAA